MNTIRNLRIKTKLFLLVLLSVAGLTLFGLFSYSTLMTVEVNGPVYGQIVQGKDLVADILPPPEYLIESYLVTLQMLSEKDTTKLTALVEKSKNLEKEYEERHEYWAKNLTDGKTRQTLVEKSYRPAKEFFEARDKDFIPAIMSGNRAQAEDVADGILKQKYEEHRAAIDEVVALATEQGKNDEIAAASLISWRTVLLILLAVVIVAIVAFAGWVISRLITKPLVIVVEGLESVSGGDIHHRIEYDSEDEFGVLAKALQKATVTLRALITETEQLIRSAQSGDLSARGNASGFHGSYVDLVNGINSIMSATESLNRDVEARRKTAIGWLNHAGAAIERLANRDLTARMEGDYEGDHARIKDLLNNAIQNLDDAMSQIATGAEQVTSASGQISTGSQALAQGASEQASSLEEVSSSLQEMSSMSKQNTAHAKEARGLAEHTRESAERGGQNMRRLSDAINKIKTSADSTAKIVKTIDEIAFQTNLLALNAAVEAARAGDAGKGFAVVAEEVRNLAMRSAEAAKNTANLIEESVKNAEGGVSLNEEVLRDFAEIQEQAKKVNEVMAEIAAASDQQAQGVVQVSTAIEQMNQVTQQTAANAEESASASEEMSGQSAEMMSLVGSFRLTQSTTQRVVRPVSAQVAASRPVPKHEPKHVNGHKAKFDPRVMIPFDDNDRGILADF